MCLQFSKGATTKFRKKHEGKKEITCYKSLCYYGSGGGVLQSPVSKKSGPWAPGVYKSTRSSPSLGKLEISTRKVHAGIHVYLRRNDATRDAICFREVVLPVKCRLDNLVACSSTEAVFTEVRVRTVDFHAALRRGSEIWRYETR